jgi:hypothetical protein
VQHDIDAVRMVFADRGRDVAGVIDGFGGAEVGHQLLLLLRVGGGDHGGAALGGELDGLVADAAGGAPDDLRLGHLTQEWLATSDEPEARSSGGYWYHQRLRPSHPAARNTNFQDSLLEALARFTAAPLT